MEMILDIMINKILNSKNTKWQISFMTIIILILIMSILSFIIFNITEGIVRKQINNQIKVITKSQQKILQNQISNLKKDIDNLTTSFVYKDYLNFISSSYNNIPEINLINNQNTSQKYRENLENFRELLRSTSPMLGNELKTSLRNINYMQYASLTMPNGLIIADSRMTQKRSHNFNDYIGTINKNINLKSSFNSFQYIKNKPSLFFTTEIREDHNLIGYFVGAVSNNLILDNLETSLGEFGNIFLIHEKGVILNHQNKNLIGTSVEDEWFIKNINNNNNGFKKEMLNDSYYVLNKIKGGNLFLAAKIPYENVMRSPNYIRNIILFISFIAVLFMFISVYTITHWQLKPLEVLMRNINKIKKGNLDVKIDLDTQDEFGVLAKNFNNMVANIKKLLQQTKKNHKEIRKMELKALQAQINPHFLYNSLDTIYWMIRSGEYKTSEEMTLSLSQFFRLSLNKGKDIISIKKEIKHIKSYLHIQKMRFPDKFKCEINIEPQLNNKECIKLIFQPIVENVFVHGFKNMEKTGLIIIDGKEIDNKITFTISDNGKGIDIEKQNKILKGNINDLNENTGYALKNIDRRIKLYYGEDFGLTIDNSKIGGAAIKVTLPNIEYQQNKK